MLTLLTGTEQEKVLSNFQEMINSFTEQGLHIYTIIELQLAQNIKQQFLRYSVRYTEPFLLFDKRFEDQGPRIVSLGQNTEFDKWLIEEAFFNRWVSLFVSLVSIEEFTLSIAKLCDAQTAERKPVILRAYTPTVLHEWFDALQKEQIEYQAFGLCREILYIGDFPQQLIRYRLADQTVEKRSIDLLSRDENIINNPVPMTIENNNTTKWLISETQHESLINARINYLVHRIRNELVQDESLLKNNDLKSVHTKVVDLINQFIQLDIYEHYHLLTLVRLYFQYKQEWISVENRITKLLESSLSNTEKIERIATYLIQRED